jgi:hypothetical protein
MPDPESDEVRGVGRTPQRDTGYKRMMDRVLVGACGLVLILVGTVWAITWGTTRAQVNGIDGKTQDHAERIKVLETHYADTKDDLNEIKKSQSKILDAIRSK